MLGTAFSQWPSYTEEEIDAVGRVVSSNRVNYWTGTEGRAFEQEFAAWVGTRRAIALANGTVALELALRGLGVGPGDEVVVTPRTFIASVSCVVSVGGTPIFADVDRDGGNLTAETIAAVLTPRTRAVIVVHLAGRPCDMAPIMELAAARGLWVIEDCAQAHGARYRGRSVGSIGHVAAWSFCQDKIMTTLGEGGMVTTDDEDLWARMWAYKDHGKSWSAVYERTHAPGFRWLHESFGNNWRMPEVQAAVGRIQLRRMPAWTAARRFNAAAIRDALAAFTGERGAIRLPSWPSPMGGAGSDQGEWVDACYKTYVHVRPENLVPGWDRDRIVAAICNSGVPCYQGTCSEVYLEKAFEVAGLRPPTRLPVARELGETSLMFLVHPTLTGAEIDATIQAVRNVLIRASAH